MQAFRTPGCYLDMVATILLGSAQCFVPRLDEIFLVRMTANRGRDRQLSPIPILARRQFGTDHLRHVAALGHSDDGGKILHAGSAVLTV